MNSTIYLLIFLIFCSGFFSATETAFSSLNKIRLKNMANNGNARASKTLEVAENYSKLISTILIGNNIVNIASASLATVLFVNALGDIGVSVSTVVMTIVVLIFGEITPKNVAKQVPETFAMAVTPIISFLVFLLTPINFLFDIWQKLITYLFKIENDDQVTPDELVTMVEEVQSDGGLDSHESDLIVAAIEFNDLEVKEILTPRVDVMAIDINENFDEIESVFRLNGFSRLPVYDGSIDNIIGVIHEKDFYYLYYREKVSTITSIIKEIQYTSSQVKISTLLRQLQTTKSHMAVVVDEYGGTAGIITMEDILEELVGEIYDEHDEVEESYHQLDENTYLIEGDVDVDDMFEFLKMDEADEDFDFVTVSGWVTHMLDHLPNPNETFEYKDLTVTVTKSSNRKVDQIKVIVKPVEEEEK